MLVWRLKVDNIFMLCFAQFVNIDIDTVYMKLTCHKIRARKYYIYHISAWKAVAKFIFKKKISAVAAEYATKVAAATKHTPTTTPSTTHIILQQFLADADADADAEASHPVRFVKGEGRVKGVAAVAASVAAGIDGDCLLLLLLLAAAVSPFCLTLILCYAVCSTSCCRCCCCCCCTTNNLCEFVSACQGAQNEHNSNSSNIAMANGPKRA